MPPVSRFLAVSVFCLLFAAALQAQDTRHVSEPKFPPVCRTISAPLESTPAGPSIGPTFAEQDSESLAETQVIQAAIKQCWAGHAVELALGSDLQHNAFLINPLSFPSGISLIIDGGVTVYATRAPANYQLPNAGNLVCGTVQGDLITGVCQPLLTFLGDDANQAYSGLYGYGIVDGQGQETLLFPPNPTGVIPPPVTWWGLRAQKNGDNNGGADVNENSPIMVAGGDPPKGSANNFTMYKVTIRNPPFHTVRLNGDGLTVWGVRIQAPWNEPNTDGFDLSGSNATLYDTIVANGDDDIAFVVNGADTKYITVSHFSAYARDGITLLGNGNGVSSISNLLFDDITITGDLPSVVTTTVNGVTTGAVNGVSEETLKNTYGVAGYAQALPNANGDVHGLNLKYGNGSSMTAITFRNVCIQDVRTPLNIVSQGPFTTTPTISDVSFENIHVPAPTSQYLDVDFGTGVAGPPGSGRYQIDFAGAANFSPEFTLSNVVFDDITPGGATSIAAIDAQFNSIATVRNVFPSALNQLDGSSRTTPLPALDVMGNTYSVKTSRSTPFLANPCSPSVPFITGELFASNGNESSTGDATNLTAFSTRAGDSISLNAVVQPIMSGTTLAIAGKTSAQNVVAIASPALTNAIRFYDGFRYVGSANLSANGTLASLKIEHIAPGWHRYTAEYPKDAFYSNLDFGLVLVYAAP
jgi:polygalacturonase